MKTRCASSRCERPAHLAAAALLIAGATSMTLARPATDADPETQLAEVVVTAQFREQRLQETPIAISVLSAADIERNNVVQLPDLAKSVPNVYLENAGSGGGKSAVAFIRGIGQGDFNFTLEPGIGIYIDDVYHSTLFGTVFDLLDLEHAEVLRGPQGTLFGKNSLGGAIRLISQKPRGDGSGSVELTLGNFDRRDMRATLDVPLVERTLFLRIAAAARQEDGYVEQLDFGCAHPDLGGVVNPDAPLLPVVQSQRAPGQSCKLRTLGDERVKSARAALRWLPSDDFEMNLVADWSDDDSGAAAQSLVAINTNELDPANPQAGPFGFNAIVAIPLYGIPYDQRFLTGNPYSTYSSLRNLVHVGPGASPPSAAVTAITSTSNADTLQAYGFNATADWTLRPALHLKSITAYRAYSGTFSDDVDDSPINQTLQQNVLDHHQFSEELRLNGTAATGALDWTAGLFYFSAYSLNRGPVDLSASSWFAPNLDFTQHDSSNVRSKAAFVDGTWHVTHRMNVTAGARRTSESKDYTFRHNSFLPDVPSLVPPTRTEVSYDRTNPRLALDYRWTAALMTYVSFATGFRAGGFNGRPFNSAQVTAFGPETLDSYEVGLKSEWLDHRLRLNVAAFRSEYRDVQISLPTLDETGQRFLEPLNLGHARIEGGEVELEAQPVHGLRMTAAFGFNRATLVSLGAAIDCAQVPDPTPTPGPGANCTMGGGLPGRQPPFLPERSASADIEYTLRLPNHSSIAPALHASYQSRIFTDVIDTPVATIPSRTLLDGRITWLSPSGRWTFALAGTNLTNEPYFINKDNLNELWGMVRGQPGRPRAWSVTLRRGFGPAADRTWQAGDPVRRGHLAKRF